MRIIELHIENFMGVEAIDFDPPDGVVIVGGKNGAGKSSVLDAIISTLAGKDELPVVPVRAGKKEAVTQVRISREDGDLIVTQTVKADGKRTLNVKAADGAKYTRPQEMLDGLIGPVGFDPFEFTRLPQKQQAERLRELVGIDCSEIDAERSMVYDERTEIGRDVTRLTGQLAGMPEMTDAPDSETSAAEIIGELKSAQATNTANAKARDDAVRARKARDEQAEQVAELKRKLAQAESALASFEQMVSDRTLLESKLVDLDTVELERRIDSIEELNAAARAKAQRAAVEARLDAAKEAQAELTSRLADIDARKRSDMASAPWPVEGLGFDEGGCVTWRGRPLGQASSAEQLDVSLAIGMTLNPELKVLMIRDGSLIDDDTMAVIRRRVDEQGFQVWVERVSSNGLGCSLVITDGKIAATV